MRAVTSSTSFQRFEVSSSGLKMRKLPAAALSFMTSRSSAPWTRVASRRARPGPLDRDGVLAKVGQPQIAQQHAAVGVRVVAHAAAARRRERLELGPQAAFGGEQLLRAIAAHPLFQQTQVLGFFRELGERHLMRAPGALDRLAVDDVRTGPALRRLQHEHRPARPLANAPPAARRVWISRMRAIDAIERVRHRAVHRPGDRLRDRRRAARSRSPLSSCVSSRAECARARSGSRSCSRSDAGSAAPRHRAPGSGTCSSASWSRAGRSPLRRRR